MLFLCIFDSDKAYHSMLSEPKDALERKSPRCVASLLNDKRVVEIIPNEGVQGYCTKSDLLR